MTPEAYVQFRERVRLEDPEWLSDVGWFPAPFTSASLAIYLPTNSILYAGDVPWPDIVHEMGHLFVDPYNPHESDEYAFFGWEYQMARMLGDVPTWVLAQGFYSVQWRGLHDFGSLSPGNQRKLLALATAHVRRKGLLQGDEPVVPQARPKRERNT